LPWGVKDARNFKNLIEKKGKKKSPCRQFSHIQVKFSKETTLVLISTLLPVAETKIKLQEVIS